MDARRLTGPNLVSPGPAALVDVPCADADCEAIAAAWEERIADLLNALGRPPARRFVRAWPGGVSLAVSAPIDALYATTDLSEWAVGAVLRERGLARVGGGSPPGIARGDDPAEGAHGDGAAERAHGDDPAEGAHGDRAAQTREEALAAARMAFAEEANPALLALESEARRRDVAFLWDDDEASVGMGAGSRTWPAREIPEVASIDWTTIHDIPSVLITGTNGKTTVVRMVSAMAEAAGHVVGSTTTEGIRVGDAWLEKDDYSGPGGARTLLRDRRVEVAVLETARGGLLRRGVAFTSADGTAVTNVAEDHLGEYGVHDLDALIEAKLTAGLARRRGAPIALNADDPGLVAASARLSGPITWFTTRPDAPLIRSHLRAGGDVVALEDGVIRRNRSGRLVDVVAVADVPLTLGGAAPHNVSNALAAVAAGGALGLPFAAITEGLRSLRGSPEDNPGRGNFYELDGARILVDFVHNPHGFSVLGRMVEALEPERLLVVLGHAGDRGDASVRALARAAWELRPDRIVVKELRTFLRGRELGEVPGLLIEELRSVGAEDSVWEQADDEPSAARRALAWARPGDLLILPTHEDREGVEAVLREAGATPV